MSPLVIVLLIHKPTGIVPMVELFQLGLPQHPRQLLLLPVDWLLALMELVEQLPHARVQPLAIVVPNIIGAVALLITACLQTAAKRDSELALAQPPPRRYVCVFPFE